MGFWPVSIRHWDIMSKNVVVATQQFFSDRALSEGINDTTIVLIPKGNNPEELDEVIINSSPNAF
jgi:hypothetical protein